MWLTDPDRLPGFTAKKLIMPNKILIADDELDLLELLAVRLKANGYKILTAADGGEVLPKVRAERPDLIILDVMMPVLNGFQVCRQIKDDPQHKDIPVILLTAKTTESDQFWGIEAGADAYVTKPYNEQELLAKIKELLHS